MKNRYAFLLGIFFTVFAYAIYYELIYDSGKSYDYYPEARKVLIEVLDEKDILYSYKIDHLKRHWVTPIVKDLETLDLIEKEVDRRLGVEK